MIYRLRDMIYGKPYDIIATQAWYNIRSFICRRHISSHEVRYHIEDISPVPTGTDIIVKKPLLSTWQKRFLHGGGEGIRTLATLSRPTRFRVTPLRPAWVLLLINQSIISALPGKIKGFAAAFWLIPGLAASFPSPFHNSPGDGDADSRCNPWSRFRCSRSCRHTDRPEHTAGNSRTNSWNSPDPQFYDKGNTRIFHFLQIYRSEERRVGKECR